MAERRNDRSPFPGMDPYLERYWESVHGTIVPLFALDLNAVLPAGLVARPELRVTLGDTGGDGEDADADEPFGMTVATTRRRQTKPDVRVVTAGDAALEYDEGGGTATLAPPGAVAVQVLDERAVQKYVEVRQADDGRVVSVIEFLSPSNKRGAGREDFIEKRRKYLRGGTAFLEIDLVRGGGDWRRMFSERVRLPRRAVTTYRAVTRLPGRTGLQVFVLPMPLREPLPPVHVPLREGEAMAEVPLQPLIDRIYQGNRFGQSINYDRPLAPPLSKDDAAWAQDLLVAAGRAEA